MKRITRYLPAVACTALGGHVASAASAGEASTSQTFVEKAGHTLGEAKLAMNAATQCYDVFVTASGARDEPLLGWITDVILSASEAG